ncbi:MAG: cyclic nucleotide-binding domain-containing protein [Planctomycetales bacterium]|nr:cyclic nucleotide-binding domain-containing protein [Planctomycetales bacterium]
MALPSPMLSLRQCFQLQLAGPCQFEPWDTRLELLEYRAGQVLFEPDEEGSAAFLLVAGRLRLYGRNSTMGQVAPGTLVGGHSRAEQWNRQLGCRASEHSWVYRWPRVDFDDFLRAHPRLVPVFDKTLAEAAFLELSKLSRLLATVPSQLLMPLVDQLVWHEFDEQEIELDAELVQDVFAVVQGSIELTSVNASDGRPVCAFGPGELFTLQEWPPGERLNVATSGDAICYRLPSDVLAQYRSELPLLEPAIRRTFRPPSEVADKPDMDRYSLVLRSEDDGTPTNFSGDPRATHEQDDKLKLRPLLELLRMEALASCLPPRRILGLIDSARERLFVDGSLLHVTGHSLGVEQEWICLLVEGSVDVVAVSPVERRMVAKLLPGEFFLIEQQESHKVGSLPKHYVANGHVRCLIFPLTDVLRGSSTPEQAATILARLSDREIAFLKRRTLAASQGNPIRHASRSRERSIIDQQYPWIGQAQESECGLIALATVARFHQLPVNIDELRGRIQLMPLGLSLLEMQRIAESIGLDAEVLHANEQTLETIELPAVLHWKDSHYVVLYRIGNGTVLYADPEIGLIKTTVRHLLSSWNGRLLAVSPRTSYRSDAEFNPV